MSSSDESDYGENMLEMIDGEDLEFLKDAVQNRSYNVLNKIKYVRKDPKEHRGNNNGEVEEKYECENLLRNNTPEAKVLLPIKNKTGVVLRTMKSSDPAPEKDDTSNSGNKAENPNETEMEDYVFETEENSSNVNTSVDVLLKYNESLRNKKVHIGYMCSSLLENPEEKIGNFHILFKMLNENSSDAKLSIRKLIIMSLLEVFKDILPTYEIKHQETKDVKLKKDTQKLYKMESSLLQYYRKYLQKLEKWSKILITNSRKQKQFAEENIKVAEICVQASCELLVTHPYFNYSSNIAHTLVPFLNSSNCVVRETVSDSFKTIFKQDKKDKLTLKIIRGINAYLKSRAYKVRPDMLEVLLHLKIKNANLDQEKNWDIKEKKLLSHKQNILHLSKKEKKRKKRLQELEKEMLEVKAEENKQNKRKSLAEIVKICFGIYFKILKNSENTKLLRVCLEGLAKFSHCINLEYYMDLLNILDSLLNENWLSYKDQLNCIQTVFTILSNQDNVINIDPSRFYVSLYKSMLSTHACSTYCNYEILLKTMCDIVIKQRKRVTNKRLVGFLKRISTLSLQLLHNGTLSCLAVIKQALELNKSADILLDVDQTVGDGDYQPQLADPEYSNAASTALYEMTLLRNHYHPTVATFAKHITSGNLTVGEGKIPPELLKLNQEQLFIHFDMTKMAFNPGIPIPQRTVPKLKRRRPFVDAEFAMNCNKIAKTSVTTSVFT